MGLPWNKTRIFNVDVTFLQLPGFYQRWQCIRHYYRPGKQISIRYEDDSIWNKATYL